MRIYFCKCGKKVEISSKEVKECSCGKVFGSSGSISDYINMRNTWSGTTKLEFSQTTIDEDIKQRNAR
tara:strand:+ start:163 stop:366 length:204 start_codon:yes stop_codon:yes gene_type:complete